MWAGGTAEFFDQAGLRSWLVDPAAGRCQLSTGAVHQGALPLVSVEHLAGPMSRRHHRR
jgi:hypothetical protein